ncbi:MAG: hypothetical protein ABI548_10565 [Polyangiaceae bacterium]
MTFMKRLSFGAAAICLVATCVSACSSGGDGAGSQAVTEQKLGTVEAGDAAKALGVAVWHTDASSNAIKGLDASGQVIAAISVDAKAGLIRTTIPDVGTRSIKNPSESTLSQRAAEFADAAKADLKSSVEGADSIPVGGAGEVDKSYLTYACYQYYSDCSSMCLYQEYYGYWHACECDYPAPECPTNPWRLALRYN